MTSTKTRPHNCPLRFMLENIERKRQGASQIGGEVQDFFVKHLETFQASFSVTARRDNNTALGSRISKHNQYGEHLSTLTEPHHPADKVSSRTIGPYISDIITNGDDFEKFISVYGATATRPLLRKMRQQAILSDHDNQVRDLLDSFVSYTFSTSLSQSSKKRTPRGIESEIQWAFALRWYKVSISVIASAERDDQLNCPAGLSLLLELVMFDCFFRNEKELARKCIELAYGSCPPELVERTCK